VYRSYLSLRYLIARRTNLIGVVGIFVAVGALILILSIMTGFLEESRRTVRGSLSDILIEPTFGARWADVEIPREPGPLLRVVRSHPGVAGATAQLQWAAMVAQGGGEADKYQQILSSSTHAQLLFVELVGIDVLTAQKALVPVLWAAMSLRAGVWIEPPRVQDEFDTTELLAALTREAPVGDPDDPFSLSRSHAPVENPLMPFLPVARKRSTGLPLASCLVGQQLYRTLRLSRGDVLELATVAIDPADGQLRVNNRRFVVAGTFRSRDNEMDLHRIYLERRELQDFLGNTRSFTQVLTRLDDYAADGRRICEELRESLSAAGLVLGGDFAADEVRTWEQFRGNLLGAIENERVLMAIMLSLVLVVAGFTIFAILSMMVTEKRRDIGILCAIGATPRGVLQLFLYIALWDALIGASLGAAFGTWAAIKIDSIERWLSSVLGVQIFNRDVYLFDHIPSIVQPLSLALIVLGAFVCALLFAAIPAWRAARLDPLDALRYE